MAVLVGSFTDKGREWLANVLGGKQFVADPVVILRNENNGAAGNTAIAETVANAGFVVNDFVGGTVSTPPIGSIVAIAGSLVADGETFTLDDGTGNPTKTFEFDKDATVTAGNVTVAITDAMTDGQVAQAIVDAINSVGSLLTITAAFATRSAGGEFFRIGEGGFKILPSLDKVPIASSDRIDKNGVQAGKGAKGDLTVAPDTLPAEDQITVSAGEVPDVNTAFFFAEKSFIPADITITQVSGVFRVEFNCTLNLADANARFISQGGGSPNFFEIGIYAREQGVIFMIGYVTFAVQMKVVTISLVNKVVFDI